MRIVYSTLLSMLVAATGWASTPVKTGPTKMGNVTQLQAGTDGMMHAPARVTADELLADPEGTVFSGQYITDQITHQGFQNSDQGRPDGSAKYYQYYSGCEKTITGVRVVGLFNYWDPEDYDWYHCEDRPGIGENNEMTNPITFEVSFYRVGLDGMPGECVYKKNFDLIGRYVGIEYGMEGNRSPLYEFIADLDEEVKLETGFMSFSAADMGDSPSCWFSLFTADSSTGFGLIDNANYGWLAATAPCIFSLLGPGDIAAEKALKVERLLAPSDAANGSHESVVVAIQNVGSRPISDIALTLSADGQEYTECPGITLAPMEQHTYTFANRVDRSAEGEHVLTVTNTTPGDEHISIDAVQAVTETYPAGEACASERIYDFDEEAYLSRIAFGSIDNESANDKYSDFTSMSTDIQPGETLTFTYETPAEEGIVGVWIDWNDDGNFDGTGELVGYTQGDPLEISIPEGVSVKAGAHRLRVVMDTWDAPVACGEYYVGETEDYTINVVRPDGAPGMDVDLAEIAGTTTFNTTELGLTVANVGDSQLDGTVKVKYNLPNIYEGRTISAAPRNVKAISKKVASKVSDPSTDGIAVVLGYDGGHNEAVGVGNSPWAIFGQYYTEQMMAAIKGMTIGSMDVYIEEIPVRASMQVYVHGDNGTELVAEQEFTPQPSSWNRVEFDSPYVIDGRAVTYGVYIEGMEENHYYIGIDATAAIPGRGDLCNIGGDTWWSMADLGIPHNFCVRANVYGEATPAISWLTLDKDALSIAAGGRESVGVTLDGSGLMQGVYEASIEIASNDPLQPVVKVPVYMTNGMGTGISPVGLDAARARMEGDCLVVESADNILTVGVAAIDGRTVASSPKAGCRHSLDLSGVSKGVYVAVVTFADGHRESFKFVRF